jgi:anti-anti-sigma regulatory factor
VANPTHSSLGTFGRIVLRLQGVLDAHSGERIRACVAKAPPGSEVVLDFAAISPTPDASLRAFVAAVAAVRPALTGLRPQQIRALDGLSLRIEAA